MAGKLLWRRQQGSEAALGDVEDNYRYDDDDYDGYDSFWWSPAGMAVRYAIVAIIFGSLLLFLVLGYYSTQRRLRRGQAPRPIFRWMVSRRRAYYYNNNNHQYPNAYHPHPHAQYPPHYADPNSQGYGMHGYPAPPPPYPAGEMPPPVYQPPVGASKAMPDQSLRVDEVGRAGEGSSSVGVEQPAPAARP